MLGRLVAVILGLSGAAAGSQAPNFTAHFMQNLEGRLDELGQLVAEIDADRERLGITHAMARAACREATSEILREDCMRAEETLQRFESLRVINNKLEVVTGWERPILLGQTIIDDP